MRLASKSIDHGGVYDRKYTQYGDNISPHIDWSEFPDETITFILMVDDFEGIEKGVMNCILLKNLPCFSSYFLIHPCPVELFDFFESYGSRSMTALLVPPTIFRLTPQ